MANKGRIFFTWVVFVLCPLCLLAAEIRYVIAPNIDQKGLDVELIFPARNCNYSYIEIPQSWTGKPFEEVRNLKCYSTEGPLRSQRTDRPGVIEIQHKPRAEIRVKYQVQSLGRDSGNKAAYAHDDALVRFTGDCAFIHPCWEPYENHSITLEWKNVPRKWTIANSFGIYQNTQRLTTSMHAISMGYFLLGDLDITRCGKGDNAPYVASKASEKGLNKRWLTLLDTIIQTQRTFWNDHDFPHFLITILPSDQKEGISGESKRNAFVVFYQPGLEGEAQWNFLAWVLTHEHFHTWNPFKMLPRVPEGFESLAWFTEGFTEYYAAVLNYRAKTLSKEQCIKEINQLLRGYYASPYRNMSNDRIQSEMWSNLQIQRQPYQRGCALALLWDYQIRKNTAGNSSLDDVMRGLVRRAKETGNPIMQKDIEAVVSQYIGKQAAADIQAYIIEGNTITPPPYLFGANRPLKWIDDGRGNRYPQYQ